MPRSVTCLALLLAIAPAALGDAGDPPPAFAPFAQMIGRWKGQAVPAADPLHGWPEMHEWAWAFEDGEPVAMTWTIEGGKVLAGGRLEYDDRAKAYRLEGETPDGKPIAFDGTLDPDSRLLTLDRRGPSPRGEERVTIRPIADGVRSTFWYERKAPGAPQYVREIEAGFTKEGVSFAGGGMKKGPQCIVTGGAATISVTAGGTTFSVCCSGCRDEVMENPEKYVAKLRAKMAAAPKGDAGNTIATGRGDGSFDLGGSGSTPEKPSAERMKKEEPADEPEPSAEPEPADEPKPEPDPEPSADPASARKAASLLRLGQALEKQGKADGALDFYKRIVDEYPETPSAATAKERIKALEGDG